jgi:hypothetical protein
MANALKAHETSNHKFLMLGDTGSGKTTQFLTLPGKKFMYLFDPNAILSIQGHDVEYEEFLPDSLNLSVKSLTKGKGDNNSSFQNQIYMDWEKDFNERIGDGFFDDYDAIGLDSATTFLDLIMDRVLTINGRAGAWPQQDDYGPQMIAFINVCRSLMALNKTIYMTGHTEIKKDELQQRIFRTPMLTGRLKTKIPLLFSDIFFCEAQNDGQGNVSHRIQTVPDRITTTVRTSFKGLDPFEDVTIDWKKPLESQGLGALLLEEKAFAKTSAR